MVHQEVIKGQAMDRNVFDHGSHDHSANPALVTVFLEVITREELIESSIHLSNGEVGLQEIDNAVRIRLVGHGNDMRTGEEEDK